MPEEPEAEGRAVRTLPKDQRWEMTAAWAAVHLGFLEG